MLLVSARVAALVMIDCQQACGFLTDKKLHQDANFLGLYFASFVLICQPLRLAISIFPLLSTHRRIFRHDAIALPFVWHCAPC
jgi:hypothetical protein